MRRGQTAGLQPKVSQETVIAELFPDEAELFPLATEQN